MPYLVINELSLSPQYAEEDEAWEALKTFSEILRTARGHGLTPVVRPRRLAETEFVKGMSLRSVTTRMIQRGRGAIRAAGQYLRQQLTKRPYLEDEYQALESSSPDQLFECKTEDGEICLGLGLAALTGAVSTSMSRAPWRADRVKVVVSRLSGDAAEVTDLLEAINVWSRDGIEEAVEALRKRLPTPKTAAEIQQCVESGRYPHLVFSRKGKECLASAGTLRGVAEVKAYDEIFHALSVCAGAEATPKGFNQRLDLARQRSPESIATMQDRNLRKLRKSTLDDGQEIVFSWHVKIPGKPAIRVYYDYEILNGKVVIGHMGKHLPTVKYK